MTISYDLGVHTERYHDVAHVPVDAMMSAAGFVAREWGDRYLIGYVGARLDRDEIVHAFQAKACDGSRFVVAASRYSAPFEVTGPAWLEWLRDHGIEATVRGCG